MVASYREAVKFIAQNDNPEVLEVREVENFKSVGVVAHIFEKDPIEVALGIVKRRKEVTAETATAETATAETAKPEATAKPAAEETKQPAKKRAPATAH